MIKQGFIADVTAVEGIEDYVKQMQEKEDKNAAYAIIQNKFKLKKKGTKKYLFFFSEYYFLDFPMIGRYIIFFGLVLGFFFSWWFSLVGIVGLLFQFIPKVMEKGFLSWAFKQGLKKAGKQGEPVILSEKQCWRLIK